MLIVSPSGRRSRLCGLWRRRLARSDQLRAVRLVLPRRRGHEHYVAVPVDEQKQVVQRTVRRDSGDSDVGWAMAAITW